MHFKTAWNSKQKVVSEEIKLIEKNDESVRNNIYNTYNI